MRVEANLFFLHKDKSEEQEADGQKRKDNMNNIVPGGKKNKNKKLERFHLREDKKRKELELWTSYGRRPMTWTPV